MAVGVVAGAGAGGGEEGAREEEAMAALGARAVLARGRVALAAVAAVAGAGGAEGGTVGTVVAAGSGVAVWAKPKTAAGSALIL